MAQSDPHLQSVADAHSPIADTKSSLEKIKKQLTAAAGTIPLQGPLFKRSETLRKWNQRWFSLDPSTGKMEYRLERGDLIPRGQIYFDADSTITISPINFHGDKKYDGCCFYIGTPHKKEYYLCAESQAVARAWVSTLRAASLVLKAHKEAVNSLSGNGAAQMGTVAAVVAAANTVAKEAARDIASEMQNSIQATLSAKTTQTTPPDGLDNLTIMKETLRVKDEELHQLNRELRARDLTIKELADRLSETAKAAESAADAAHTMDRERKYALALVDRTRKELEDRIKVFNLQLKAGEESYKTVLKERDEAMNEVKRLQDQLAKAREHILDVQERFKRQNAENPAPINKEKTIDTTPRTPQPETDSLAANGVDVVEEDQIKPEAVQITNSRQDPEDAEEAVKSQVVEEPKERVIPNEREVRIDKYSADVDVPPPRRDSPPPS